MLTLSRAKQKMIDIHLRRRGIADERVIRAMEEVPREDFVEPGLEEFAYEDSPLGIGEEQTISQPYIVALMLEMAGIEPDDVVLEVGTGSGYAAAVMSRLARFVYSVERHASLAAAAEQRFLDHGYRNIEVRLGDGAKGWPEAAPFAAILVAAAGTSIPVALTEQLDIGGRLIIPVEEGGTQRLFRVTRTSASTYREEDLGSVRFVPLISDKMDALAAEPAAVTERQRPLTELIASSSEPLASLDDPEFAAAFDRFADSRVVLLGEATHGTSEFYRARAAITRRLIEKHGFNIVAVEADWPDGAAVDRYVRQREPKGYLHAQPPFQRFPRWMWRNAEFSDFVAWMRRHNAGRPAAERASFHGLDLYNLSASIAAVLDYLEASDPRAAAAARERYGCLTPWQNDPSTYGRAVVTAKFRGCESEVTAQWKEMLARHVKDGPAAEDEFLDAVQSARLVANAERYYRVMYYGGAAAWNLRDNHMADTLAKLLEAKGPCAKAVVWAHNSHIGDARATDMSILRDEVNLGQRCRERYGDGAALIGFGTHGGEVAAATDWDGAMEIKSIRPGLADSYERLLHDAGITRHLIDFRRNEDLRARLASPLLERFIGVIYRPETERSSHYAGASLSRQFDAFVWFDRTGPVSAIDGMSGAGLEPADTFPFGL